MDCAACDGGQVPLSRQHRNVRFFLFKKMVAPVAIKPILGRGRELLADAVVWAALLGCVAESLPSIDDAVFEWVFRAYKTLVSRSQVGWVERAWTTAFFVVSCRHWL